MMSKQEPKTNLALENPSFQNDKGNLPSYIGASAMVPAQSPTMTQQAYYQPQNVARPQMMHVHPQPMGNQVITAAADNKSFSSCSCCGGDCCSCSVLQQG